MLNLFKKKKIIVTHGGGYHADDIFACATISLFLEKKGESFKIIRIRRDEDTIKNGDFVFDVGGIYDPKSNRYDHHQVGGAGERENTIPYAAFGLAWKHFGKEVCESKNIADRIDKYLVQPIDASDNGVDITKSIYPDLVHYRVNEVFAAFLPTTLEDTDKDDVFMEMVSLAKKILIREIKKNNDAIRIEEIIKNDYQNSTDKRLVIIEKNEVSRSDVGNALKDFSEPLFVVYKSSDNWNVVAMRADKSSFKNRKDLPKEWAGLRGKELAKITNVSDAIFCHNKLFLASTKSKEGAIKLAQIALASQNL